MLVVASCFVYREGVEGFLIITCGAVPHIVINIVSTKVANALLIQVYIWKGKDLEIRSKV